MEQFFESDSSDVGSSSTYNMSVSSEDDFLSSEESEFSSHDDSYSDDSFSSDESHCDGIFGENIAHCLIFWTLEFGISHNALTSLLQILKRFGHRDDLPKHAKTLLNTPRKSIQTRDCAPGKLAYFGIETALMGMDDRLFESSSEVVVDFYIDGMTASKSSKWEIWPVMGGLVGRLRILREPDPSALIRLLLH